MNTLDALSSSAVGTLPLFLAAVGTSSTVLSTPILVLGVERADRPTQVGLLTEVLSEAFASATASDVVSLADLEFRLRFLRVKEALGCTNDSEACDVAAARQLEFLSIAGAEIHRLGDSFVCSVKAIDTKDTSKVQRVESRTEDEAALPDALRGAVLALVNKTAPELSFRGPIILGSLGAIVSTAGVVLGLNAVAAANRGPTEDGVRARAIVADGAIVAGSLSIVIAAAWAILQWSEASVEVRISR